MKKKLLITLALLVCAVALVVGSVAGTMAYLRSTAEVVNTFTYGKVAISMDETLIGEDGLEPATGVTQRTTGNRYKLMPGTTYVKDPQIHIGAESEEMYLFLKVDNGIRGLALNDVDDSGAAEKTIHEQLVANGWNILPIENNGVHAGEYYSGLIETPTNSGVTLVSTSTVYFYGTINAEGHCVPTTVDKTNAGTPIKTFETFTTSKGKTTEASMTAYVNNNAKIAVTAFAVQSSGFDDIHEAADVFAAEWTSALPTVVTP